MDVVNKTKSFLNKKFHMKDLGVADVIHRCDNPLTKIRGGQPNTSI